MRSGPDGAPSERPFTIALRVIAKIFRPVRTWITRCLRPTLGRAEPTRTASPPAGISPNKSPSGFCRASGHPDAPPADWKHHPNASAVPPRTWNGARRTPQRREIKVPQSTSNHTRCFSNDLKEFWSEQVPQAVENAIEEHAHPQPLPSRFRSMARPPAPHRQKRISGHRPGAAPVRQMPPKSAAAR